MGCVVHPICLQRFNLLSRVYMRVSVCMCGGVPGLGSLFDRIMANNKITRLQPGVFDTDTRMPLQFM